MKTNNMYIEALRITFHRPGQKISLNVLAKLLREKGYQFESHRNTHFTFWYFTNFYVNGAAPMLKNGTMDILSPGFLKYYGPDTEHELTSDAVNTFVEHENLIQAKKDAKDAKRQARIAIWVTCIIGAVEIVISYVSEKA